MADGENVSRGTGEGRGEKGSGLSPGESKRGRSLHGEGRTGEAEDGREVTPTQARVGATSKGTDFSFAR